MSPTEPTPAPEKKKEWGPWKPVTKPGYNPPDTQGEIRSVLTKYTAAPTSGGVPDDRRSRKLIIILATVLVLGGVGVGVGLTIRRARDQTANANANVNVVTNEASPGGAGSGTAGNANRPAVFPSFENSNVSGAEANEATDRIVGNGNEAANSNVSAAIGNRNANASTDASTNASSVNTSVVDDPDRDGLTDDQERQYKTDPRNPDTDSDGFLDGVEVENGYNPKGAGTL